MATTSSAQPKSKSTRQRVPASERRDALIDAAIHEFAATGYHGTPVDRIARAVGVAQPYVFSLFGSKRELFLAAVDRCYARLSELLTDAAAGYPAAQVPADYPIRKWMGDAYIEMLTTDRDSLMLQLQSYAACDDPIIRDRVRANYARLVRLAARLMGPDTDQEELDDFFRYGMWLNVTAAMGAADLSVGCEWISTEPAPHADA
jgi:AcrR family transcriptional regulator